MASSTTPAAPRRRSFWAWGWEDKLPDPAARAGLASMAEGLLGVSGLVVRDPPRIEDARIGPSRVAVPREVALAAVVTDDREERIRHTYGRSFRDLVRGFRGDFQGGPDLVARPRDEADVERLLAWAVRAGVAVIPWGGGTSVVGGVEAAVGAGHRGALALDLAALDRVLEVDLVSRAARIQAGALGPSLEAQLAPHGVTLRHFPQSFEFSTLGGWIATRAGGHFATLYTHIDDLVESIRMITPTGAWDSRRLPASGAGPSPDRLALGSEGILGVITEAWVRVQARPRWRARASVRFERFSDGAAAARAIAQAGLYPANARLLEDREALLNGVAAAQGKHVLLLAFESADHPLEPWIARAVELARAAGGVCDGWKLDDAGAGSAPGDASIEGRLRALAAPPTGGAGSGPPATTSSSKAWRDAFLDAPYLQSALLTVGVMADTFETACTWDRHEALDRSVREAVSAAIERACGRPGIVMCRFTHVYPDGPAPYFTWLAPARPGVDELAQWAEIKQAAGDAIEAAGGTITHHHAVGRIHRPWYDRERPPPFARALAAAKGELDPAWILNPGVLLDPPDRPPRSTTS
jgi:alkyldihydroxyacetonephosphate synthase